MVDTCCDPTTIDYVIPANDDAAKSIQLITDTLCGAIAEGLEERRIEKEKEKEEAPAREEAPAKRVRARRAPKAEEAQASEEPKNE